MTALQVPQKADSAQPDISYHPDLGNYKARTKRRLDSEKLVQELPKGFPQRLQSPLVWEGDDFRQDEWVVTLTESEILELDSAIENFKGTASALKQELRYLELIQCSYLKAFGLLIQSNISSHDVVPETTQPSH